VLQKELLTELSKHIIAGTVGEDDGVLCDYKEGKLIFTPQPKRRKEVLQQQIDGKKNDIDEEDTQS